MGGKGAPHGWRGWALLLAPAVARNDRMIHQGAGGDGTLQNRLDPGDAAPDASAVCCPSLCFGACGRSLEFFYVAISQCTWIFEGDASEGHLELALSISRYYCRPFDVPISWGRPASAAASLSAWHDRPSLSRRPHPRCSPSLTATRGESSSREATLYDLASISLRENLTKPGSRFPQHPLIQPPAARDAARPSGSSYDRPAGQSDYAESTSPPASPVGLDSPSRPPVPTPKSRFIWR